MHDGEHEHERAVVLCCDGKNQVQALDRTQLGSPLKQGRAEIMTHVYGDFCKRPTLSGALRRFHAYWGRCSATPYRQCVNQRAPFKFLHAERWSILG